MAAVPGNPPRIGWIGVGRMGAALVRRLLDAGYQVAVYNRTRSKADELAVHGAEVVDRPVDLADRDIVFTMVSASDDLEQVTVGEGGLLTAPDVAPAIIVPGPGQAQDPERKENYIQFSNRR